MEILQTTNKQIKKFRQDYLNSLPEFQELFLELMVNDSDFFILQVDNVEVGYAIRNNKGVLIEYYVKDKFVSLSKDFFRQVLANLSINEIYCKSFDALLLSSCLLNSLVYKVIGVLYRHYNEALIIKDTEIVIKKAGLSSVDMLLSQDNSIRELFETEQQLTDFIQNETVFEFYKNDQFFGCGTVIPTMGEHNFCDLGVWVIPSKRGNSLGSQILLNLRDFALKSNMIPSCGCAIENISSQRTIEKSGYISKYNMLSFKPKSNADEVNHSNNTNKL